MEKLTKMFVFLNSVVFIKKKLKAQCNKTSNNRADNYSKISKLVRSLQSSFAHTGEDPSCSNVLSAC